ncbi:MAG TPA: hypothetical protein VHV76_09105 [Mycobacteriales bacterium]|jgi:hypothetical protein|nr:hypothetical protein [Mycobacteriales bacterium]
MADSVQLTDLDVIARYSIAVRSATADRDELLETLRADLAWLERGRSRTTTYRAPVVEDNEGVDEEPVRRPAARATRAPAKKVTTKKIASRRVPRA